MVSDGLGQTATSLEQEIVEYASKGLGSQTEVNAFADVMETTLNSSIIPSVKKSLENDQKLVSRYTSLFQGCETSKGSGFPDLDEGEDGFTKDTNASVIVAAKSKKLAECRKEQAKASTRVETCSSRETALANLSQTHCKAMTALNLGFDAAEMSCDVQAGEAFETYIARNAANFKSRLTIYDIQKNGCKEGKTNMTDAKKQCSKSRKNLTDVRSRCDSLQRKFETATCRLRARNLELNYQYDLCYNRTVKAYKGLALDIKNRESNRVKEWESIHRVKCMIAKFKAGQGSDVSACQTQAVTEALDTITYITIPARRQFVKEAVVVVPCSKLFWETHYKDLPEKAPAIRCTPCPGAENWIPPTPAPTPASPATPAIITPASPGAAPPAV